MRNMGEIFGPGAKTRNPVQVFKTLSSKLTVKFDFFFFFGL